MLCISIVVPSMYLGIYTGEERNFIPFKLLDIDPISNRNLLYSSYT